MSLRIEPCRDLTLSAVEVLNPSLNLLTTENLLLYKVNCPIF